MDWAASAIKPGRQSLNRTSMDRDVPREWLMTKQRHATTRDRDVCVWAVVDFLSPNYLRLASSPDRGKYE